MLCVCRHQYRVIALSQLCTNGLPLSTDWMVEVLATKHWTYFFLHCWIQANCIICFIYRLDLWIFPSLFPLPPIRNVCVGCIVVQYARIFDYQRIQFPLMDNVQEMCVGLVARCTFSIQQRVFSPLAAPCITFGLSSVSTSVFHCHCRLHWMLMKMNLEINCNNGTVDFCSTLPQHTRWMNRNAQNMQTQNTHTRTLGNVVHCVCRSTTIVVTSSSVAQWGALHHNFRMMHSVFQTSHSVRLLCRVDDISSRQHSIRNCN